MLHIGRKLPSAAKDSRKSRCGLGQSTLVSKTAANIARSYVMPTQPGLVLAVIAFNLTGTAATIAGDGLGKATTGTIRRKLIRVPARAATSARQITLHRPQD